MASTCSATFTIEIAGTSDCTLTIGDPPTIRAAGTDTVTPASVPNFSYTPGTDHVPTHANYGFSLNPTSGMYPAGITITNVTWAKNEPTPAERQPSNALMTFTNTVNFDINISSTYTGGEQSFSATIELNTGV